MRMFAVVCGLRETGIEGESAFIGWCAQGSLPSIPQPPPGEETNYSKSFNNRGGGGGGVLASLV